MNDYSVAVSDPNVAQKNGDQKNNHEANGNRDHRWDKAENHLSLVEITPFSITLVRVIQRVLDAVISGLLLTLLLPVFVVIAALIRWDSPGPILFIQRRVGRGGQEFPMLKFRSMVKDAEAKRATLELKNERSGPVFKMKNDPRITRVGRVLRKYSLDELPQLVNVLKGEMSLIGPRPALPREVALYTDHQRQRLTVTPGLTGLWQVSGRSNLSFERNVELDLHYIRHQSLTLNLVILCKTIPTVIAGEGAY